ncbi:arylsulfatase [Bacillaceae bacterium SIJ1]|uniref:sulfatase family protein n=1 Tax=Litoribacterium kuwaitense TaxID=1398745 RepID=UPI0013ECEC5B|nr:arylsulfatase [Litoribacterium kuwaitense]NGP45733.1 arylsulfatase [Litoribacterium kuwaitense]
MSQPNIIYILTDDMGYGDLSCYTAQQYQTKHIDRLADEGRLYTDAHSTSAVCTPSRYSILTGRYCWRGPVKKGVLHGHDPSILEPNRETVASYLKSYGYRTACIGKWHLGLGWAKDQHAPHGVDYTLPIQDGPIDHGFDYFYGISASLDMPPYCFIENDRTVGIPSVPKDPVDFSQEGRDGFMVPGWKDEDVNSTLTEKALDFIKQHDTEKEDPFFLYLSLTGPHTPWLPKTEFHDQSGVGPRGDLILEIDDTVGQILSLLEEKNMRENTMVIFTSDNGPDPCREEMTSYGHMSTAQWRGQKADIWEGGHRVPFIVSWPVRVPEGTVSHSLLSLSDLMATCAAIVDGTLPQDAGEDSMSQLSEMTGQTSAEPLRESIILHSFEGMLSLRKGDWKYIRGAGGGGFDLRDRSRIGIPHTDDRVVKPDDPQEQLYQLVNDEEERVNKIHDAPEKLLALSQELDELIAAGRTRP